MKKNIRDESYNYPKKDNKLKIIDEKRPVPKVFGLHVAHEAFGTSFTVVDSYN